VRGHAVPLRSGGQFDRISPSLVRCPAQATRDQALCSLLSGPRVELGRPVWSEGNRSTSY